MKQEIIRLWSNCNQKCLLCNKEDIFKVKSKNELKVLLLQDEKQNCLRMNFYLL